MNFDWDADKEKANIRNHDGITFDLATKVFNDVWAIEEYAEFHSNETKQRFTIIGAAEDKLLRVTFTVIIDETGEEVIRIISARKAVSKDREGYEKARKRFDISND